MSAIVRRGDKLIVAGPDGPVTVPLRLENIKLLKDLKLLAQVLKISGVSKKTMAQRAEIESAIYANATFKSVAKKSSSPKVSQPHAAKVSPPHAAKVSSSPPHRHNLRPHCRVWSIPLSTEGAAAEFLAAFRRNHGKVELLFSERNQALATQYMSLAREHNLRALREVSGGEAAWGDLVLTIETDRETNDGLFVYDGEAIVPLDYSVDPTNGNLPPQFAILGRRDIPIEFWTTWAGPRTGIANNIVWVDMPTSRIQELLRNDDAKACSSSFTHGDKKIRVDYDDFVLRDNIELRMRKLPNGKQRIWAELAGDEETTWLILNGWRIPRDVIKARGLVVLSQDEIFNQATLPH